MREERRESWRERDRVRVCERDPTYHLPFISSLAMMHYSRPTSYFYCWTHAVKFGLLWKGNYNIFNWYPVTYPTQGTAVTAQTQSRGSANPRKSDQQPGAPQFTQSDIEAMLVVPEA